MIFSRYSTVSSFLFVTWNSRKRTSNRTCYKRNPNICHRRACLLMQIPGERHGYWRGGRISQWHTLRGVERKWRRRRDGGDRRWDKWEDITMKEKHAVKIFYIANLLNLARAWISPFKFKTFLPQWTVLLHIVLSCWMHNCINFVFSTFQRWKPRSWRQNALRANDRSASRRWTTWRIVGNPPVSREGARFSAKLERKKSQEFARDCSW